MTESTTSPHNSLIILIGVCSVLLLVGSVISIVSCVFPGEVWGVITAVFNSFMFVVSSGVCLILCAAERRRRRSDAGSASPRSSIVRFNSDLQNDQSNNNNNNRRASFSSSVGSPAQPELTLSIPRKTSVSSGTSDPGGVGGAPDMTMFNPSLPHTPGGASTRSGLFGPQSSSDDAASPVGHWDGLCDMWLVHVRCAQMCNKRVHGILMDVVGQGQGRGGSILGLTPSTALIGFSDATTPSQVYDFLLSAMATTESVTPSAMTYSWGFGVTKGEVIRVRVGSVFTSEGEEVTVAERLSLFALVQRRRAMATEMAAACFTGVGYDCSQVEDVWFDPSSCRRAVYELVTATDANFSTRTPMTPADERRFSITSRMNKNWSFLQWQLLPEELQHSVINTSAILTVSQKEVMQQLKAELSIRPNNGDASMPTSPRGAADSQPHETSYIVTDGAGHKYWANEKERIGSGKNGTVFMGMSDRGVLVALKVVDVNSKAHGAEILREAEMLSSLNHANVLPYISCALSSNHKKAYLITQFVSGGSLQGIRKAFGATSADVLRKFMKAIVSAVKYLHSKDIVHGDIKPANVLVDTNGVCKLADFGSAIRVSTDDKAAGTPMFMAPEHAQGRACKESDIWSLGALLLYMATGTVTFTLPYNDVRTFLKLMGSDPRMTVVVPPGLDPFVREMASVCLVRDPDMRISIDDLMGMTRARSGSTSFTGTDLSMSQRRLTFSSSFR